MLEAKNSIEEIKEFGGQLRKKLDRHFCSLSKPVLKNITEVVIALVLLLRTPRGWYGRMTLCGIARCMRTKGDVRVRSKRLDRLLRNNRFSVAETAPGLLELACGEARGGFLPVLIDQTALTDVQVISASFAYQSRAIPMAIKTFEYEKMSMSQNKIEKDFFVRIQESVKDRNTTVLIMDRGYAKAEYLGDFNEQKQLYIIRGRSEVIIEYNDSGRRRRIGVGRLPHRQGYAKRYCNVTYHDKQKVLVDIIVYREKGFKEPWFLLVPAGSEKILATEEVVELYRSRMRIEVKFRDFKSCLGVRGLKLQTQKAEKIGRLLVCMAIAYVLLIAMGSSELGKQIRKQTEVLRKTRRHGTRRTLSVLTVALLMATDSLLLTLSNLMKFLASIVSSSAGGLCCPT